VISRSLDALTLATLRDRCWRSAPGATVTRRCPVAGLAAGVSAVRSSGAILTVVVVIVRRLGACKTQTKARRPAQAAGRVGCLTLDIPLGRRTKLRFPRWRRCERYQWVTTRSHRRACDTFASSIWLRADDRAAASKNSGAMMHARFLTRRPRATNYRN
jgi:hypothetical protein